MSLEEEITLFFLPITIAKIIFKEDLDRIMKTTLIEFPDDIKTLVLRDIRRSNPTDERNGGFDLWYLSHILIFYIISKRNPDKKKDLIKIATVTEIIEYIIGSPFNGKITDVIFNIVGIAISELF
jgi:hypothetical protein